MPKNEVIVEVSTKEAREKLVELKASLDAAREEARFLARSLEWIAEADSNATKIELQAIARRALGR